MKRGVYIVIEGIDGSGKSTLASNLYKLFQKKSHEVVLTKEPGGTPLGKYLRELVQNPAHELDSRSEFLLFAADRAEHRATVIDPSLEHDKIVISDRSADSSVAYQGYGRGLDIDMIQKVNRWAMDERVPDITIYVAIDYQTAKSRMKKRDEAVTTFENEQEAFFNRVAGGFRELYKDRKNLIVLDGKQSIDCLTSNAFDKIKNILEVV